MDNDHLDRRVRRTKAQVVAALTSLLADKELKDISVSELTRLADINRGTFYLHYRDTYDLFAQVEEELMGNFLTIIDRFRGSSPVPWQQAMKELFGYIEQYAPSVEAVLRMKESTFLQRIVAQAKPATQEEWRKLFGFGSASEYEYCYAFVTNGCIALVTSWFLGGRRESAEDMATLADRLMSACTRELAQRN